VAHWITVLSQHTVFTNSVTYYKFTSVWYSVKQGTMHRPTSNLAHLYIVPFLCLGGHWQQVGWWFRWPLFVMATSAEACFCCCCCSYSSSSSKQSSNTASLSTWFRCQQPEFHFWIPPPVLLTFFQPLLNTHKRLPCLDYYVWLGTVSEMQCQWDINMFYSDSKTDLKLPRHCCIKIPTICRCPRRCY